jgi:hypothetical protein
VEPVETKKRQDTRGECVAKAGVADRALPGGGHHGLVRSHVFSSPEFVNDDWVSVDDGARRRLNEGAFAARGAVPGRIGDI